MKDLPRRRVPLAVILVFSSLRLRLRGVRPRLVFVFVCAFLLCTFARADYFGKLRALSLISRVIYYYYYYY